VSSYVRTEYQLNNTLSSPEKALKDLTIWMNAELDKIEAAIRVPEVISIQFEINYAVPKKYKEGDLVYFSSGVNGASGGPGLFIRDNNSWRKL